MSALLRSRRLVLRAVEPEDLPFYYEIENDTALWNGTQSTGPFSRYVLRRYLEQATADVYADGRVPMVVTLTDGTPIGLVDLYELSPLHQRAEIGLVICPSWQHQGYAMEALNMLLCYASSRLHLHQIYAIVAEDNKAACGLFRRAGFCEAAHLQDWLCTDNGRFATACLFTRLLAAGLSSEQNP